VRQQVTETFFERENNAAITNTVQEFKRLSVTDSQCNN